jgi:hypothetical protein
MCNTLLLGQLAYTEFYFPLLEQSVSLKKEIKFHVLQTQLITLLLITGVTGDEKKLEQIHIFRVFLSVPAL